jgi:hypothetical protein
MLVDDGMIRASFRRRRTEKAHLAVWCVSLNAFEGEMH